MRHLLIIISFLISACASKQPNTEGQTTSSNDEFENDHDYRSEFIKSYTRPTIIDTSFTENNKKYRVLFTHFSKMDNGLVVPAKYNFDTKKEFVTHNFVSELILISDRDTVFKTQIEKAMFSSILDSTLEKYATLLFPTFQIIKDTIKIGYSISIPVTDLGLSASIKFDKTGKLTVQNQ